MSSPCWMTWTALPRTRRRPRLHLQSLAEQRSDRKPPASAATVPSHRKLAHHAPAPATIPAALPLCARPTLSNTDIDRVIDELVAEALPKLEKALRLRLRDALRRKN